MNTALWQPHGHDVRYAQCWALSMLLHVAGIGLTIAWLSDLHLAPRPEAFRWQVSVVGAARQPAAQETTVGPADPLITRPAPVTPSINEPAPPPQNMRPVLRQAETPHVLAPEPPPIPAAIQAQRASQQVQPALQAVSPHSKETESATVQPPQPASTSESTPPTTSSPPAEEPATMPSRDTTMVARIPIDTPPAAVAPARTLEFGSSTGNSPSLSPPIQDARLPSPATGQPDFTWLTDSLRSKVLESQKYSTVARLNGMEGRVVLRVTVKKNGELLIAIATSSGHDLLDQDAMEQVKRLSPLPLQQPLGREQKVLNLPIIYSLNR